MAIILRLLPISSSEIFNMRFVLMLILFIALSFPSIGRAFTISPTLVELTLVPGETGSHTVRVYNDSEKSVRVTSEVMNMEFGNEAGEPNFVTPQINDNGLASWITWVAPFDLTSHQSVDLPVSVSVPEAAIPGTYAVALLFNPTEKTEGEVSIVGKTGPVILLTVTGEIRNEGRLLGFGLVNEGDWLQHAPNQFNVTVENTGTVYFVPTGSISIQNTFGQLIERLIVNPDDRKVLPDWRRSFKTENTQSDFSIGRYTATLDLQLGDEKVSKSFVYWVVPWKALAVIGVGLIGLVSISRVRRRHRRII